MKNDKVKTFSVVLLDADGKPVADEYDDGGRPMVGTYPVIYEGAAGVRVSGLARVLYWSDEGKTWKRAEESR